MISLHEIQKAFGEHGVFTKPARDVPKQCRELWNETTFQPVSYDKNSLQYFNAYYSESFEIFQDASLVIFHDRKVAGFLPLSISLRANKILLSTFGLPIYPPLYSARLSEKVKQGLSRVCVKTLKSVLIKYRLSAKFFAHKGSTGYLENWQNEWHLEWLRNGAVSTPIYNIQLDLSQDINSIFSGFRKSYRPLIRKASGLWSVEEYTNNSINRSIWKTFHDFHLHVSGRVTRNETTWKIQYRRIKNGNAVLFILRDKTTNKMVGGSYFTYTKNEAVYSAGVYDRDLFDKPLGHLAQWSAIQYFKRKGIKFYLLGERQFLSDIPSPTTKELGISLFKEGFARGITVDHLLEFAGVK